MDLKDTIKDLRRKIRDITFQRSDLLMVQRRYRIELNRLIELKEKQ